MESAGAVFYKVKAWALNHILNHPKARVAFGTGPKVCANDDHPSDLSRT